MREFNNDKDNFNKSLKTKFNEASYVPSHDVWEGIESALLKQENVRMQKKAMWYRNTAAAILAIALISIYFNIQSNNLVTFAADDTTQEEKIDLDRSDTNLQANLVFEDQAIMPEVKTSADDGFTNTQNIGLENDDAATFNNLQKVNSGNGTANTIAANDEEIQGDVFLSDNVILANKNEPKNYVAGLAAKESMQPYTDTKWDPIDIELEKVSYFAISEIKKEKRDRGLNLQANLNFGSGSFNPNANITSAPVQSTVSSLNSPGTAGRTTNADFSSERQIVEELSASPMRSNISLTYGANFGFNLGERWVIKSGLQYGNYRSSSESSTIIRDVNSERSYPYHGASSTAEVSDGRVISVTSEYDLNNNFEILSVPLFVTYKLLNTKFGIGIVAGATADFLLRNTITGASDQLSEVTFDGSDKKSYRNNFASGTVGLEFSYAINEHYGFTLTPLYKKALMDVTTNASNFSSTPDFVSINLSFQYIF